MNIDLKYSRQKKEGDMKKTVYSLVLDDEIVEKVDLLALR